MRIGFVVDATCDLPDAFLERHGVRVLPNVLELGGRTWIDERDPEQTMMLYRRFIADRSMPARLNAASPAVIRDIFLQELVLDYDRVLVLTAADQFSAMHAHATEASYSILQAYRERREAADHAGSFALRVLDSRSLAAGEGIALARAVQLREAGNLGFEKIRGALRDDLARLRCVLVAGDPWYLRRRGLDGQGGGIRRGEHLLGVMAGLRPVIEVTPGRQRVIARRRGFEAACAAALGLAQAAVDRGLGTPALVLSFGGDPRVIRQTSAYQELESAAASARLDLNLAVMSASAGARIGPGALSVSWLEQA
ncbi:MAG: DegV family protein [Gammaproteobacteria bacterium]|jgi:fatty acid-binding protein DegV